MGSDPERDSDADYSEYPQHEQNVDSYYMARYLVTVAQFRAYVDDSGQAPGEPYSLRGRSNHPVVYVSWREALAYCGWLTEKLREWDDAPQPLAGLLREQGWRISLPSEAQWEKAVRGADGRIYPWGDDPDPDCANYNVTVIGSTTTSAVGCFPGGASPYGLLDMSGNVYEWTLSLWGEDSEKPQYGYPYDPQDGRERLDAPDTMYHRMVRGGSSSDGRWSVRCAYRSSWSPLNRLSDVGFRVCASPALL